MLQLSQLLTPPLSWLPFLLVPAVCRYGAHVQMQMCGCYLSEATLVRSMRTISYHSCRGNLFCMYLTKLTFLSWPPTVTLVVERSKSGQILRKRFPTWYTVSVLLGPLPACWVESHILHSQVLQTCLPPTCRDQQTYQRSQNPLKPAQKLP